MMKFWVSGMVALMIQSQTSFAQKIDDERMTRDIEVAENVLSTLIKHEVNQQRTFFGLEIQGSYQQGYGVTFRLPGDYSMPFVISTKGGFGVTVYGRDNTLSPAVAYSRDEEEDEHRDDEKAIQLREASREKRRASVDSIRDEYNKRLIQAAKDFIIDYGDFISQLAPNERIIVTNQGENRSWYFKENKRTHISIEGTKADVTAFKQGKITREQAIGKLKVVNTESVEVKEPDMELLASIFNRLYRPDLSTTYFSENNTYYERLRDYGAIFYMQVYSSSRNDLKRHNMPTVKLDDVDQETRNKKVVELLPKFEQELKENILEYGRTLKSLKDEEVLVFNVRLTDCQGCKIPASLEISIKNNALQQFSTGKLDKNTAMGMFSVKKVGVQ